LTLVWLAVFGIVTGVAQLVMMVVHLRRLEALATAQIASSAQWIEVMAMLHADLRASRSPRGRVAACNDASSTVEQWLNYGLGRRSGWRICATSGIAAGCAILSTTVWGAGMCLSWGLLSAFLAASLGRRADSVAERIRGRWNGLIRSLSRSFPDDRVHVETV
jgi:hypothetical protein